MHFKKPTLVELLSTFCALFDKSMKLGTNQKGHIQLGSHLRFDQFVTFRDHMS